MDSISTKSAIYSERPPVTKTAPYPVVSYVPLNKFPISQEPLSHLLPHLPKAKRQQLQAAIKVILDTSHPNKANKPIMLILFGSYARGNWIKEGIKELIEKGIEERVEEQIEKGIKGKIEKRVETFSYQSCFDILAITKNEALAKKIERKDSLHNRLRMEVQTPVHLIAEDIHRMNMRLDKGHYFFTELVQEGIVLYDSGDFTLAGPLQGSASQELRMLERKALAQRDFNYWFEKATKYKEYANIAMGKGDANEAAFFLHQSAERFYNAMLLVFVRYKPNSHDLGKLSQLAASIEPLFVAVFPQGSEEDKTKFELLRQAYVNARYKPSFTITENELEWLANRVGYLQNLTEQRCQVKIASYG